MGEHGILPNGLLPSEAETVTRELDTERWAKAEERTAELIGCIQPSIRSEERRIAVADYVQRLIMKCFPCQVFTFGSVPLKTYLPDGDIDLTAFSKNQSLKDTWAHQVRDILESEEKNENSEFRVKEVQYIQAEVKIIKCLVENIVVDISFNQLGGLCTLCFLEKVDHLINQDHLFKRSIILIKAWCYYESRILGAHHGLISTYALETLVLYIFHVFNSSFAGPLEVLYRFLEFFSKFDWDNFCVSLWGPVPISSLPNVTAESPRKDGGELLLSKLLLDACSSVYSAWPPPESQGQPFASKHFNVIDPLRVNNNLGRSVSKGNFYRIRSAFAFGAKRLARLLNCPEGDIHYEVNQFFSNTWDRHGKGDRPDTPNDDLNCLRLSNSDPLSAPEKLKKNSDIGKGGTSSDCGSQFDHMRDVHSIPSLSGKFFVKSSSRSSDVSVAARSQSQNSSGSINNSRTSDLIRQEGCSSQGVNLERSLRNEKPDPLVNDVKGRFLFAKTHSSPELTDSYSEVPSQVSRNRVPECGKGLNVIAKSDSENMRNLKADVNATHSFRSSTANPGSVRSSPSCHSHESAAEMNNVSNGYHDDSGSGNMNEELDSGLGTRGMHQGKQNHANIMAASAAYGVNGQFSVPLNLASGNLPLQFSPSFIGSMEYSQRNLGGIVPTGMHIFGNPWAANMQYPPGLVSTPMNHYFPGFGLTSNSEDMVEPNNENFVSVNMNPAGADRDYWHEQEGDLRSEYDQDNGNYGMHQEDDKQQSTSVYDHGLSRVSSSESATRVLSNSNNEFPGLQEDYNDTFQQQEKRINEVCFDDRKTSSRSSSLRSKSPSESSLDGSSAKVWKSKRDRQGRKAAESLVTSNSYGKSVSELPYFQGDEKYTGWDPPSRVPEMSKISTELHSMSSLQMPGPEQAETSGSESVIPVTPMLLGPGSRERTTDNPGSMPFTFYPTGPPVPFVAMLPLCNFQNEAAHANMSISHLTDEEGTKNNDSEQNFDASERLDQPEESTSNSIIRVACAKPEKQKSDILNGDFASYWQNLQYGCFCQNSQHPVSLLYPSPVAVPPVYLHGRFPWDGPCRPVGTNADFFTQLTSYGPCAVPVAPPQSVSSIPAGMYGHCAEDMPRYRSGTGTYFPNPKAALRDRHSTSSRKGNYSYDRSDRHGDREENWNVSKSRAASRSRNRNRNQGEKPGSRPDRISPSHSRGERPWTSHRRESHHSFQSHNGPIRVPARGSPANVTYGMHSLPAMDTNHISSNGPNAPSFVFLYPYDHGTPAEQLEFGSLGPVGLPGLGDASSSGEASEAIGSYAEQSVQESSEQGSSYNPTSHVQR